jgi:hypothetical protein
MNISYSQLMRLVVIGHVAFYCVIGVGYGALVVVRGVPPTGIHLPFGSGQISGWRTVGEPVSTHEAIVPTEPLALWDGIFCFFAVASNGLINGIWAALLAAAGMWLWSRLSARYEAKA